MSKFKSGDRVRVRKPADVDQEPGWVGGMEKFDGTEQEISEVNCSSCEVHCSSCIVTFARDPNFFAFHPDWLEPVEPKTLNVGDPVEPMQSWVPEGYSVVEMAVPDAMAAAIGEGNAFVWRKPVIGERFCSEDGPETSARDYAHYYYPVIVPTTPPAPQYREPTAADVGRTVEVSQSARQWSTCELLAVLPEDICMRFIVRHNGTYASYPTGLARIKIEESK